MNRDIFEQLKDLKNIAPDPEFAARAKRVILAAPPAAVPAFPTWRKLALGIGTILVIAFAIVMPGTPKAVPIASAEALNNEFNNLSINIEIQQISYNQSVNQTIASALTEIAGSKLSHLNPAVLKSESAALNANTPASNPQIDDLLQQAAH